MLPKVTGKTVLADGPKRPIRFYCNEAQPGRSSGSSGGKIKSQNAERRIIGSIHFG